MRRANYFGTVKVNTQVLLKSICMNLKKAANKIFVDQPLRGAIRPNVAQGGNSPKKRRKTSLSAKMTCNQRHLEIFLCHYS
jgi:hypothetical protein